MLHFIQLPPWNFEAMESLGKSFELPQDKCKFDESDKKLGIDFASGMEKAQRVAKWNIGASERWVGWMHPDGRIFEMCPPAFAWCLGCPLQISDVPSRYVPQQPVILLGSKNSGCVWDALFKRQGLKTFYNLIRFMREHALQSISVRESDNGGAGPKSLHHEANSSDAGDRNFWIYCACMLHQMNLVVARVCKAHNQKVVSLLWSLSNLFSTGNFWLRFILSIDVMKHSHFKIEYREPDPDDLLHWELVARFFWPHGTRGSTERSRKADVKWRAEFLLMCNGPPMMPARGSSQWVHRCHSSCRCVSPEHSRQRCALSNYFPNAMPNVTSKLLLPSNFGSQVQRVDAEGQLPKTTYQATDDRMDRCRGVAACHCIQFPVRLVAVGIRCVHRQDASQFCGASTQGGRECYFIGNGRTLKFELSRYGF